MIGRSDSTISAIYTKIKHIVDEIYRKKGLSSEDIRNHFMIKKNFKKLLKVLGELRIIYEEGKYPISFESQVNDILFYRVLMDRIYFEKDNPQQEDNLFDFDEFTTTGENTEED
jgi:predicted transcriptional regulator